MSSAFQLAVKDMGYLIEAAQANIKYLPAPVVNVQGYGAVGDGVTDDTAAIQKAIDYAIGVGKREVYFPAGSYKYGTLTNYETIVFIGDGVTLIGGTPMPVTNVAALQADNSQRVVNVKSGPYNAKGDGTTDDTAAIQSAIDAASAMGVGNLGAVVYFPPGVYKISSSLTVLGGKFVSFLGAGKPSTLAWYGDNNLPILSFDDGSDEMQISIEKLRFLKGNSATGTIGIQMCKTPGNALVNVTIAKCLFEDLDTAVETWTETDQLAFRENYVLRYGSYGMRMRNGTNSNYLIRDNHFRGGATNSWAIKHEGGANILIDGNTFQTANTDGRGIELTNVTAFRVTNSYYEVNTSGSTTGGPFISLISSNTGTVENNYTSGNLGLSIITIDASCANIKIGPNEHAISGGTPTQYINIASGAADIIIIGQQKIAGGSFTIYTGHVSFYVGDTVKSDMPIAQYSGFKNIDPLGSGSLFSIEPDTAYFVYVKNFADNEYCMGIIQKNRTNPATVFTIQASNSSVLSISASGDSLQASNPTVATRTIEYSAFRMF